MHIEQLQITNFRNYVSAELKPAADGVTVLQGSNGAGKTNFLEAVAYVATLRSFRGAPKEALVRTGQASAVVRALAQRTGRALLIETEITLEGRDKVRLNRQNIRRADDLAGSVLVSIFSPDDIEMVKGGPQERRQYLDDLLASLHPKHAAVRSDLERVLRQRNALLRSTGGNLRPSAAMTLDVWDAKLASVGQAVAEARDALAVELGPVLVSAYGRLSGNPTSGGGPSGTAVSLRYQRSWEGELLSALHQSRQEDVRRGVTGTGPQRDELFLAVSGLPARTQASQGEQRSLALALRLAGHELVCARQGTSPVLLLDDVFSELDPDRCNALANCLPAGQALLTTAVPLPQALTPACEVVVKTGQLVPAGPGSHGAP